MHGYDCHRHQRFERNNCRRYLQTVKLFTVQIMRVGTMGGDNSSGQPAVAHLGLGTEPECDLEIVFPHGRGTTTRRGVKANSRLVTEN